MGRIRYLLLIGILLLSVPNFPTIAQTQSDTLIATTNLTDDGFIFIDVNTGNQFALSFGPETHLFGDFSPDGCQITFMLEKTPNNYDLFVADLDGSNFRQVMLLGRTGALNYRVFEPQWSPDGEHILMTLIRYYDPPDEDPERQSHIVWVTPDGSAPTFYSSSGYEWQPRWSPDGAQIVYVSEQPLLFGPNGEALEPDDDAERFPEIWLGGRDGDNKRRLTNLGTTPAFNPRWSPDGSQLSYLIQLVDNNHRLLVFNFNTGNTIALNQELATVLDYTWQADGNGLIAAVQGFGDLSTNALWAFELQQYGDEQATTLIPDAMFMDYPRLSPDGRWLAFRSAYELVLLDNTTGELLYLGDDTRHNSPPVWSPMACEN